MRHSRRRGKLLAIAMMGALPLAVACSDTGPAAPTGLRPSLDFTGVGDIRVGDGQIEMEQFELCKQGSDATFKVDIVNWKSDGTRTTLSYDVPVADGECWIVWESGGPGVDTVTATEYVPSGYTASWSMDQLSNNVVTTTSGSGNQVEGYVTGLRTGQTPSMAGVVATFTNTPIPPGGGEGCTPGFWKQSQHFSDWTGFAPSDMFTAPGFADAFPGMTLLDVLWQGGGGIKALGRHAVAALLNSTSSGVDYDLTTAQVVQMFNDAYNGVTDIEATKNIFAGYNEQEGGICN